jgi:hypothetical protein
MEDAELYAELLELEELRGALESDVLRRRIAASLETAQRPWWRVLAGHPLWMTAAVATAALVLLMVSLPMGGPGGDRGPVNQVTPIVSEELRSAALAAAPVVRASVTAQIVGSGAVAAGSTVTVRVWCGSPSLVFAVLRDADGNAQTWKSNGKEVVMAGGDSTVELSGDAGTSGRKELRVVVVPAGVALAPPAMEQASIVRLEMEVQ